MILSIFVRLAVVLTSSHVLPINIEPPTHQKSSPVHAFPPPGVSLTYLLKNNDNSVNSHVASTNSLSQPSGGDLHLPKSNGRLTTVEQQRIDLKENPRKTKNLIKGDASKRGSIWMPGNRYKRIRVCPFLNRVGFPLGGCLYSYIKPTYRPPPPPPKPTPRPKTRIARPVIMWQPYHARWPEFYFLGGALGRR